MNGKTDVEYSPTKFQIAWWTYKGCEDW